jgi:hypothetical protein
MRFASQTISTICVLTAPFASDYLGWETYKARVVGRAQPCNGMSGWMESNLFFLWNYSVLICQLL